MSAPAPDTLAAAPAAVDRAKLLAVVAGDRELLSELIGLFFEQVPSLLAEIDQAIASGDGAALRRSAHTLKGSLLTFAAAGAAASAQALELIGAAGELHEAGADRAALTGELARVHDFLVMERSR